MTDIYNGNFMKQLLIDPVILSAVTLTHPFVMVQRPPLWPQSSGLNASPVKTLLSELPFLCLLTAARWRHKTLLSRRQHKLRVKELLLQTVAILNTNIVVIIASYLFLNNEIFLQSRLPFDLFKLVDVKRECTAVCNLVVSHAFTLFLANTLVLSNVGGSLFKLPPLRSGGTSAQKIKEI